MANINGNAPKLNLGLSTGIVILLALGIVVGGLYMDETKNIAMRVEEKQNAFVDKWEKRIQISNKINNGTQAKILALQNNQSTVLSTISDIQNKTHALTGSEYARLADMRVKNIIGNTSQDHELIFEALNVTRQQPENIKQGVDLDKLLEILKENMTNNND